MRSLKNFMAVDPGTISTGVAMFFEGEGPTCVLIEANKKNSWEERIDIIVDTFNSIIESNGKNDDIGLCIIETPIYFDGKIAATLKGDTIKLAILVGCFIAICRINRILVKLVTPNQWKGQLSKEVVIERIKRRINKKYYHQFRRDMWDAVGIGLWYIGAF